MDMSPNLLRFSRRTDPHFSNCSRLLTAFLSRRNIEKPHSGLSVNLSRTDPRTCTKYFKAPFSRTCSRACKKTRRRRLSQVLSLP